MLDVDLQHRLRHDCVASLELQPDLPNRLAEHRIAVIGGTGFIGTWIAESVAALNDELGGRVRLYLLGRSVANWEANNPHLAARNDLQTKVVDVRCTFDLPQDATLVLFAAGVADPRVHASDPIRIHETAITGMANSLSASARLEKIHRFLNLSSGLVSVGDAAGEASKESDLGILDFTRVHNVYAESRRAAENLVSVYASQYRIPTSTARAFTFLGAHQPFDAPWAVNSFIRDALSGVSIRVYGDGSTRRSYVYGSDAAAWLLRFLVDGQSGEVYNLGGAKPISHAAVAEIVASKTLSTPQVLYKTQPSASGRCFDFFPDSSKVTLRFGLTQAFEAEAAVERTMLWHASRLGVTKLIRKDTGKLGS